MRYKIQKLQTSLLAAVLLVSAMFGVLHAVPASADSLTQDVACVSGASQLTIAAGSNHSVNVSCKDGSKIIYNTQASQQNLIGVSVTCGGSTSVASHVTTPNAPNPSISFYCVIGGGSDNASVQRSSTAPVVKPVPAVGAKCPDGVTDLPANGDPSGCPVTSDPALKGGNCGNVSRCDLITKYINPFINFLAALVGIAVVISIIIGGIQYGSSAGDPQKVTMAKNRIRNAIIALVTFLFLYALLRFLLPGGGGL